MTHRELAAIERTVVSAYTVPTEEPESDGTLEWASTTLVLVNVEAGGLSGLGYTYADKSAAVVIRDRLFPVIQGRDALAINDRWIDMTRAVRNAGRPGIASTAIAAVDTALWDLKARLLEVSLAALLGTARDEVAVYGSGGFTSYSDERLRRQLASWSHAGMRFVKMKVGRDPDRDLDRVRRAADALCADTQIFVDANGAYSRKQALRFAEDFAALGVSWLEEPVSSDDLEGLRLLRDRAPGGLSIVAGEYGYDLPYFRHMLEAGAVDVLQADATRCAGITGFMAAAALAEAHALPVSSHTAPALHLPLCCAARNALNLEYFHDHARIERLLFAGTIEPARGLLAPDLSRAGLGLEFKHRDAERYAA